jgi:tetratricopeptide (TPR) repeat protein
VEDVQKLDRIVALWAERVEWWGREFDLSPPKKVAAEEKSLGGSGRMMESSTRSDGIMDDLMEAEGMGSSGSSRGGGGVAARPAAKKAKNGNGRDEGPPPPSIALRPWDPKTPYLAALKAASAADRTDVYLAQRATFGTSPAFFLDCSDFFADRDQRVVALRILSNLAELELEDPALLRVFAHRLTQIGELDLAILTFERIRELRPDEPQSHRDLALALAARGAERAEDPTRRVAALNDYQLALDGLAKVVMDEWERFAEIELIALVELNDFLPRAQQLGDVRVPVDSRLIDHLDMDIRIVMSWDADMTDMDLHVMEPSGEEAYYSFNRTRIGGRVSRDFTQGYGPEEYSIRKAMTGKYILRTKFFGSSAAQLQGAVTLYVDLYTDYGRPTQQKQSITLRLTDSKETFTVGEITFEKRKPKKIAR